MLSEISQSQRTTTVCFHFCAVPRAVKLIKAERRMLGARGWKEGGMGTWCLMGTEFRFGKDEKVLELENKEGSWV